MSLAGTAAGKPFRRDEILPRGTAGPLGGESLTSWVVRNMEPVVVDDVSKDTRYRGSRSSLRAFDGRDPDPGPQGRAGRTRCRVRAARRVRRENLAALTAMASQLSIALAALGRRDVLSRIYAFGQRISESDDGEIVAGTLDFLAEQFSYPLASIFRQGRDGRHCPLPGCAGPTLPGRVDGGGNAATRPGDRVVGRTKPTLRVWSAM